MFIQSHKKYNNDRRKIDGFKQSGILDTDFEIRNIKQFLNNNNDLIKPVTTKTCLTLDPNLLMPEVNKKI